jgi:D-sedoheptulose 7-phosphate isomerase
MEGVESLMIEIEKEVKSYILGVRDVLSGLSQDDIKKMVEILFKAYEEDKQIFTMGNGGHGSTATHFVNDLLKHTIVSDEKDKVIVTKNRVKAMCLCDNISTLTAWANDLGYEYCFSEQLANWVEEGDVVIGISGSGNSENVLKAFEVAREKGAITICLTGRDGGRAKGIADLSIIVPTDNMLYIEDIHLLITHLCCDVLKKLIRLSSYLELEGERK